MCADCHSTSLRRNYNLASNSYATTWSEINVSCESCHGPGSNHVERARSLKKGSEKTKYGGTDLAVDLKSRGGSWGPIKTGDATMHWNGPIRSHNEIETCAPVIPVVGQSRATTFLASRSSMLTSRVFSKKASIMPMGKFWKKIMNTVHSCKARCTSKE
jgi:hypothetical protein